MNRISAADVRVGDRIAVRHENPKTESKIEVILTVDKVVYDPISKISHFMDSDGDSVGSYRYGIDGAIFLIERKPDLAREMLDLYNATEGNRMVRMRALVDQLGLVKSATNAD